MLDNPIVIVNIDEYDPIMNLAVNESLLESVARGDAESYIRIFTSRKPALILSSNEDLWDIRTESCNGVPYSRRITSGSVIYFDQDCVGYSIISKSDENNKDTNDLTYLRKTLSLPIAYALRDLGVSNVETLNDDSVDINGRPVAGNAQIWNLGKEFELHGMLRLKPWPIDEINQYIKLREFGKLKDGTPSVRVDGHVFGGAEKDFEFIEREFDQILAMPGVSDYVEVGREEIIDKLLENFVNGNHTFSFLTKEIYTRARELYADKYLNPDWIQRKGQRGLGFCFVGPWES